MAALAIWTVAVLAVVGRSFVTIPEEVEDAWDWWVSFAIPTALASLIVGLPLAGAAWFLTASRLRRKS